MSGAAVYVIGAQVHCADGACGELERVVIDPVKRAITHLVVKRRHGHDVGRLVPIKLVEAAAQQELRLRCTRAEFEALDYAKETEFVPAPDGEFVSPANERLLMPDFGPEDAGGMGEAGPGASPPVVSTTGSHQVKSKCDEDNASMRPTVRSDMSVGSSSTQVTTR